VISVSRDAGIPVARETAAKVSPIGFTNSSNRISPGWIIGRYFGALISSVVVGNFNLVLQTILPAEDDSPLLVDSNTPVSLQISAQSLKSVARWDPKILNDPCLIDHTELAARPLLNFTGETTHTKAFMDFFGIGIAKAFDHQRTITQI